ncbi:MAG: hypothetical protein MRY21_04825 [Simkaniaceae bacterium]|nr:hypothetical protein [Simkaniaceae bacterium]
MKLDPEAVDPRSQIQKDFDGLMYNRSLADYKLKDMIYRLVGEMKSGKISAGSAYFIMSHFIWAYASDFQQYGLEAKAESQDLLTQATVYVTDLINAWKLPDGVTGPPTTNKKSKDYSPANDPTNPNSGYYKQAQAFQKAYNQLKNFFSKNPSVAAAFPELDKKLGIQTSASSNDKASGPPTPPTPGQTYPIINDPAIEKQIASSLKTFSPFFNGSTTINNTTYADTVWKIFGPADQTKNDPYTPPVSANSAQNSFNQLNNIVTSESNTIRNEIQYLSSQVEQFQSTAATAMKQSIQATQTIENNMGKS